MNCCMFSIQLMETLPGSMLQLRALIRNLQKFLLSVKLEIWSIYGSCLNIYLNVLNVLNFLCTLRLFLLSLNNLFFHWISKRSCIDWTAFLILTWGLGTNVIEVIEDNRSLLEAAILKRSLGSCYGGSKVKSCDRHLSIMAVTSRKRHGVASHRENWLFIQHLVQTNKTKLSDTKVPYF